MALKHNLDLEAFGSTVTVANAYIRVQSVSGTKQLVSFLVEVLDESMEQRVTEMSYSFEPSMSGSNFIAQAYQHLKTLPEFAGAADV